MSNTADTTAAPRRLAAARNGQQADGQPAARLAAAQGSADAVCAMGCAGTSSDRDWGGQWPDGSCPPSQQGGSGLSEECHRASSLCER